MWDLEGLEDPEFNFHRDWGRTSVGGVRRSAGGERNNEGGKEIENEHEHLPFPPTGAAVAAPTSRFYNDTYTVRLRELKLGVRLSAIFQLYDAYVCEKMYREETGLFVADFFRLGSSILGLLLYKFLLL